LRSRHQQSLFDDVRALPPLLPSWSHSASASRPYQVRHVHLDLRRLDGGGLPSVLSQRPAGRRLEEYVRYPLFRTVGIDSAFYEPPSERCSRSTRVCCPRLSLVSKVWDRITARRFTQDPRWGNLAGTTQS